MTGMGGKTLLGERIVTVMKHRRVMRSCCLALFFGVFFWCSVAFGADSIDSREYKILLIPDIFVQREQGYQDYWNEVKQIARDMDVGVTESSKPFAEESKQVVYLDSKSLDLTKQNYILRIRTKLLNGMPASDCELTLKYRVPKLEMVPDTAVETSSNFKPIVKFQEDLLGFYNGTVGNNVGEFSVSHTVKKVPAAARVVLSDYAIFFPTLRLLGLNGTEPLFTINDLTIYEYKVSPGELDFGGGVTGDVDISVWYDRSSSNVMIGELSYEVKLSSTAGSEGLDKCEAFFNTLQQKTRTQLYPGQMKVQFVYDYNR